MARGLGASMSPRRLAQASMRAPATHVLHQLHRTTTTTTTSSASIPVVSLAYDVHEPARPVSDTPNQTSPILFLHGLFGSKKNNRSVSKALARDLGRSVYALVSSPNVVERMATKLNACYWQKDLRNHGDSPHDSRHDYAAMAEDLSAFVQEHRIELPTIIGHSMGAKTAMTLALRSPGTVKNIVAVDNAPVDANLSTNFAKYVQGMKKVEEAGVSSTNEADNIMAEFEKSPPIRQFLLGNLYTATTAAGQKTKKFRIPLHVFGAALAHMGDFPYKDPSKVRFEKPALFVRGTKSKYVPDEVLPVVGQFFPLFEVVDVEAGHWVISENPEAFIQAVVHFLGPKD